MNCPNCQAPIEQDFGMVTCHQCQHVFFIDVDGSAQSADVVSGEAPVELDQFQPLEMNPSYSEPSVGMPADPISEQASDPSEQTESDVDVSIGEASQVGLLSSDGSFVPSPVSADSTPIDNLSLDVTDFANSDNAPLSYNLLIERIDTGDIRNLLSAALSDDRFGWDVREMMGKIKDGVLEIRNINPAKLVVLMNRLRKVPVSVRWSQTVYEG